MVSDLNRLEWNPLILISMGEGALFVLFYLQCYYIILYNIISSLRTLTVDKWYMYPPWRAAYGPYIRYICTVPNFRVSSIPCLRILPAGVVIHISSVCSLDWPVGCGFGRRGDCKQLVSRDMIVISSIMQYMLVN